MAWSSRVFGNDTDIVHWKDGPKTRGTSDILSSCVITLLLCAWTAVHLNVAPPERYWKFMLRKTSWLLLALLAPEMVAYTAWSQRQEARSIMQEVNKVYGTTNLQRPSWLQRIRASIIKAVESLPIKHRNSSLDTSQQPNLEAPKSIQSSKRHPWTLTHGFYALMGGLAVHIPEDLPESERFLPPDGSGIWFVARRGIALLLAEAEDGNGRDEFPDLSYEDVKAKSKADGLAKTLVCAQASWFIAQCLNRLIQGTPISLLELNTFGHAICALLIYTLWWEKPFEVSYPTIVSSQSLWDLCALLWMQNPKSEFGISVNDDNESFLDNDKRFRSLPTSTHKLKATIWRFEYSEADFAEYISPDKNGDAHLAQELPNESIILAPDEVVPGTRFRFVDSSRHAPILRDLDNPLLSLPMDDELREDVLNMTKFPKFLLLSNEDVKRWKRASNFLSVYDRTQRFVHESEQGKAHLRSSRFKRLLERRISNWPDTNAILDDFLIFLAFTAAALIYGGLHALAWSADFRTLVEQTLWRLSASAVMAGNPVFLLFFTLLDKCTDRTHYYWFGRVIIRAIKDFSLILVILIVPAYILARVYLVVECFIGLTHLPAGAFDVPDWAAYFPHI